MQHTLLKFPEINLPTRAAHQLRGYFGDFFREKSPLLHNHYENGDPIYRYPLIQYKVVNGTPMLLGIGEGAPLLLKLFLEVNELKIADTIYPLEHKHLKCDEVEIGYSEQLHEYRFETLWMALNQRNFDRYHNTPAEEQNAFLERQLQNHILAIFKGLNIWLQPHERIMVKAKLTTHRTQFKDKKMLAFGGTFVANVHLPPYIGIGKSVSRGFGTIRKI